MNLCFGLCSFLANTRIPCKIGYLWFPCYPNPPDNCYLTKSRLTQKMERRNKLWKSVSRSPHLKPCIFNSSWTTKSLNTLWLQTSNSISVWTHATWIYEESRERRLKQASQMCWKYGKLCWLLTFNSWTYGFFYNDIILKIRKIKNQSWLIQ